MTRVSIAGLLVPVLLCNGSSLWAQQKDAGRVAAEICASCHGPGGVSTSPAFPRLAGQNPEYLTAQLKAFRDRTRADPMAQAFMWGMASQLSDEAIAGLAAYYAVQKPANVATADVKLLREGQGIFTEGIPAANVTACQSCHRPQAEGNGAIPRLAGQLPEYMLKQRVMFKSELRAGASATIMHGVSTGMTFEQMQAVAAYAASR
jgi:cytochrome c553